ncbi:polysaccharide biosynthesis C-terminal domain-containing protein [Microcystis sp.]|jgi:O-antigen/teichoic acid export membrane protein|uniref:polysaccharide biosynthesis C-terminal domain-containing protein n=1 Tax=Microcystis sp. TaxID=1127 RepID=UPI00125733CC|nr:hypothetical protein MiTa_03043 [Microcystis aeruginosa NIES-4264]
MLTNLLGKEYTKAGRILVWHIWSRPIVFVGIAFNQWMMVENMTLLTFARTSLGAIANVGLNFLLIPHYGRLGAAIATVISYGFALYGLYLFFPFLYRSAWMVTKAFLIHFRLNHNLIYLSNIKNRILL